LNDLSNRQQRSQSIPAISGAADRLDFTVISSAVNVVSRVENAAKTLGQPIVVSAELAAAFDGVVWHGRPQCVVLRFRRSCSPQAERLHSEECDHRGGLQS
jgi:class 3 adenylate cyclase